MFGLVEQRFWDKVDRAGPDDCWLWRGAKTPAGYGKLGVAGRTTYAHHIALHLSGRPRAGDALTLHSCDNPSCVNPLHLQWGDQQANMRDALTKGRAPHVGRVAGGKNGNAKLTEASVLAIRQAVGTQPEIAAQFGVSRSLVSQIRLGKAWRHLCPPAST